MEPINQGIYELLMRQAISARRTAIRPRRMNKSARRSHDGAAGEVVADSREGGSSYPPTAGGGVPPMRMGKGREPKPAPVIRTLKHQLRFGEGPEALVLEVHTNPNLSNTPKHGLAHAPRVSPLGASPCLRVIQGGRE